MDARRFLWHLATERNKTPGTINIYNAAIRFFFAVTLNRTMNYLQMPRMKRAKTLPVILSKSEVSALIDSCINIKHKALLLLAYGSGLRVGELIKLKVEDIDSKAMRVFVRDGEGQKDRYTILSVNALLALRDYWRRYRPKSLDRYLFPGIKNVGHLSENAVADAIESAVRKTGINKKVSPHTLRHCFATHLLEDGYNLLQIKEMLGHYSIQSTTIYLHLANTTSGVTSPADKLSEGFEDCPL
jgi:site-specific recombinase XerD